MIRIVVLTLAFIAGCTASDVPVRYDFTQIATLVEKTLTYLESNSNVLSREACDYITWGLADYYTIDFGQNIRQDHKALLDSILERTKNLHSQCKAANGDQKDVQLTYMPETWGVGNNYSFIMGRIEHLPPVSYNLERIKSRSVDTPYTKECYKKLIESNDQSEGRVCANVCEDLISDVDLDTGFSPCKRAEYISVLETLNCTNLSKDEYRTKIRNFCEYFKRETDTLYNERSNEEFRPRFLARIFFCGSYGYPEFYNLDYIKNIAQSIREDGSVGADGTSEVSRQTLTAQSGGILGSVLRYILELIYDPKCV